MPLVTTTEMFKKAYDGGYAIGAFNVNNMEIVQGITEAAKDLNAPLILQVSKGARNYANHTYLMKLVEAAIEETGLPIALHLDHGDTFELCKSCIDGGFTSVMIDASSKSFEDNIALTRQVVEYAHDHGVVVEAELGTLAGVEDEVNVSVEVALHLLDALLDFGKMLVGEWLVDAEVIVTPREMSGGTRLLSGTGTACDGIHADILL